MAALSLLRELKLAPEGPVYDWQLDLLSRLTSLTLLSFVPEEEGGMLLGPLPGSMLALPMLEVCGCQTELGRMCKACAAAAPQQHARASTPWPP